MSERKQIIKQIKELGIKTIKPAHMCTTSYLKELLPKEEVKVGFFKRVLRGLGF
jgi:metal-dependent hydrolase (beta-lactamase superfamily II)